MRYILWFVFVCCPVTGFSGELCPDSFQAGQDNVDGVDPLRKSEASNEIDVAANRSQDMSPRGAYSEGYRSHNDHVDYGGGSSGSGNSSDYGEYH